MKFILAEIRVRLIPKILNYLQMNFYPILNNFNLPSLRSNVRGLRRAVVIKLMVDKLLSNSKTMLFKPGKIISSKIIENIGLKVGNIGAFIFHHFQSNRQDVSTWFVFFFELQKQEVIFRCMNVLCIISYT